MTLIGIVGFINSGKSVVGDYLQSVYQFKKDSFANPLKNAVSIIFGWDRQMLEGMTDESREWREKVDPFWSEVIGREVTPRLVLQEFGTECIREVFNPNVWSSSLIKRWIEATRYPTVITDCRFKNEIKAVQDTGGKVWRVRRGDDPEWVAEYLKLYNELNITGIERIRERGKFPHKSETDWIGSKFDEVIENDGTLNELYGKIDRVMNSYYEENAMEVIQ